MPISEKLLRKINLSNEECTARDLLKMLAVGVRYPDGNVPPMGVSICRDWLREGLDEDSFEFHLLNLVDVRADDREWSINGVAQGGVWALIKLILGEMSAEDAGWIETDMYVAYQALAGMAKEAAERRAALGRP